MDKTTNKSEQKKFTIKFKVTKTLNNIKVKKDSKPKQEFKVPKKKKLSYYDEKYKDTAIVGDNHHFETQDGSIQQFINSCHPEVRQFLNENGMSTITASISGLTVVTKNKLRISIKPTGRFTRKIVIKDKKGKILLDTESSSEIKRNNN
jgi:hypothetical protein